MLPFCLFTRMLSAAVRAPIHLASHVFDRILSPLLRSVSAKGLPASPKRSPASLICSHFSMLRACLLFLSTCRKQDKQPRRTADGFEEAVGVNHLGHFLLCNLLIDELKQARVVFIGTETHNPGSIAGKIPPQVSQSVSQSGGEKCGASSIGMCVLTRVARCGGQHASRGKALLPCCTRLSGKSSRFWWWEVLSTWVEGKPKYLNRHAAVPCEKANSGLFCSTHDGLLLFIPQFYAVWDRDMRRGVFFDADFVSE